MQDRVVVITGASAGIGAELARQLAQAGAKVALAARDKGRLQQVAAACPGALVVPTDVTDEAACKALIQQTVAHFGRLDALVNNAGLSMWALFEEITDLSLFRRIMEVNYYGTVYCTHAALPHLKQSRGLIVGVTSATGKTGVPTRTAYSASKHAVHGLLDSLRIELLGSGVDVLLVCPGFVQTEVRERALGADGQPLGKSHLDESAVMKVEDCARVIVDAMQKRRREVMVGLRNARALMWLKLIAPQMLDRLTRRRLERGRS